MFINCRSIHGSLLFVMIVLKWDGQHLVISALTTESFWVAHFIEIVSEFGWLMCRYFPLTFHCLIALLFHPPGCWDKIYYMSPFSPSLFTCFLLGYQHVEPYGVGAPEPDQSICTEVKFNPPGSHSLEKVGIIGRSTSGFRSTSPDCETKDIKTIYVDCKFFSFSFYFLVYCLLDISLLYFLFCTNASTLHLILF